MFKIIAIATVCVGLSACATITRGSEDTWVVNTDPQGAEVLTSNGHHCAATPCAIKMKRKSEFVATLKKEGFKDGTITVSNKVAGAGAAGMAGNVIFGGIIGAASTPQRVPCST